MFVCYEAKSKSRCSVFEIEGYMFYYFDFAVVIYRTFICNFYRVLFNINMACCCMSYSCFLNWNLCVVYMVKRSIVLLDINLGLPASSKNEVHLRTF